MFIRVLVLESPLFTSESREGNKHKNMYAAQIFLTTLTVTLGLLVTNLAKAELDWFAGTLDNDLFLGNDNGYTNGIFLSAFEAGRKNTPDNPMPDNHFWVAPLMWSMPEHKLEGTLNAYTIGQIMSTPSDIRIAVPDPDELPYAALLFVTNSYITISDNHADKVGATLGMIGPAALGEEAQKFVHDIIGADEPQGWDTQLKNEVVFQFSRARLWRNWHSANDRADLLTFGEISAGTIHSGVKGGAVLRYGRGLSRSYGSILLNGSRISNPVAVESNWHFYTSLDFGYTFNQIFTDGNTFRDSRSIDYDRESIGLNIGFAYSWRNYSITLAVVDTNIIQHGPEERALDDLTQYGTLTLAWRR